MERRNFFKFFPALLVAPLAMVKAITNKNKSIEHPIFAAEKYFMSTPGHRTAATSFAATKAHRRLLGMAGQGDWLDAPMTKKRHDLAKENKA